MPRPALALPVLVVAGALVASSVAVGAAAAAAPHGRSAIDFHTTANHRVAAPATTRPGIAHLRNTGKREVFIAEAKKGSGTRKQLGHDLRSKSPETFLKHYRLTGVLPAGSGTYTRLSRGTYYLLDIEVSHLKVKRFETMTVSGSHVDARTPKGRGLVVTSHRHLRMPGSISRSGYLHVQNHSSALAGFLFVGVDTEATRAMLSTLIAHPSFLKLFEIANIRTNPFSFAPLPEAGPHSVSWVHYHGKPGRYIATVLTLNRSGEARLHRGQLRVLTLT